MKRLSLLLSLLLALSLVVGGCANEPEAAPVPEPEPAPVEESTDEEVLNVDPALVGTTLNVFAAYGGKEEIFAQFEEDTGIKIEFLDMSSGEVLARMQAEAGSPIGDIWFGGGVDSFIAADNDDMLERYVSPFAGNVPAEYKDADGAWTGISLVVVSVVFNTEVAEENGAAIPETWEDLTKPEYAGELLMPDPSISGTAYTTLSGLLQTFGEEEGWELFARLDANMPYYAQRGGEPPTAANMGEIMAGIAPGIATGAAEGYPVVTVFPKDGTPWWPAPVAIMKGAPNLEAAKVFVDWCLTKHGQEVLAEHDPRPPVRDDVPMPQVLIDTGFPEADLMTIDFVEIGRIRSDVIDRWQEDFASKK